ncbi:MAG TPA: hypothetical protein VHQ86_05585 [Candidatus Saccharimonadia bacterium]|jgi:hypothetical protein|nr:hypothetical protein [Candidatus Saccharimonadia bacterium]
MAIILPLAAHADAPGLQLSPLEYRDHLTSGRVKTGYVDVSNPGDSPLVVQTSVRAFRQTGTGGQLEFYDDPALPPGIKIGLSDFNLGPRESIRVSFTVDPDKLPGGDIFAALFFSTVPPAQNPGSSYVSESASLGTLLELVNGPEPAHSGTVSRFGLPFWQFGHGLTGSIDYHNTSRTAGFRPALSMRALPWSKPAVLNTGLVLPGITRHFALVRTASYFGLLPVTITDADTHTSTTRWVFACTGIWQWIVLVLIVAAIILLAIKPQHPWRALRRLARRLRRRKPAPKTKRPLDGLSRKSS